MQPYAWVLSLLQDLWNITSTINKNAGVYTGIFYLLHFTNSCSKPSLSRQTVSLYANASKLHWSFT